MCMFCAAVPLAAAMGARLNVAQNRKAEARRLPISKLTGGVIVLLLACSVAYHTLTFRS
jgi:hypothetical protein